MEALSRKLLAGLCAAGAIAVLSPAAAGAATITPTITTDENTANGDCSLREAVTAANTDGDHNGCVATGGAMVNEDDDTIVLQSGQTYSLSLAGVEDLNAAGDLDVRTESLAIQTGGAARATIDGNGAATGDRVLELGPFPNTLPSATVTNLVLTDGVDTGAGIWVNAATSFVMIGSRITGNNAPGNTGSGIRLDGFAAAVIDSSIDTNTGTGSAVFHEIGSLTITGSTISGNTETGPTDAGAGISTSNNPNTNLTIVNSTVTGNSSRTSGGGIAFFGSTLNLRNSTVAANTSDSDNTPNEGNGGGLFVGGGTVNVRNSIIADNIDLGGTIHQDCSGTIVSELHNIIGSATGCTGVHPQDDFQGASSVTAPLNDNGGPTLTRALLDDSVALNPTVFTGPGPGQPCEPTDQRGFPRGGAAGVCDPGAFEAQPPVLAAIGNRSVQAGQNLTFVVSATDPDPADSLAFSASNLPSGATFNAGTRTFSWTPTAAQVRTFPNVGFEVTDGSFVDNEAVAITVTPVPTGGGTVPTGGGSQPTTQATGQRAAALKKCKRKRGRAKKRCKKRAQQLPV